MKSVFNGFSLGIHAHFAAFNFIRKKELQRYFLFPFLLNILVFIGGIEIINFLTENILVYFQETYQSFDYALFQSQFITDILYWTTWISLRIFLFFLFAYIGGYIVLLLLSPVLSLLSEKVEEIESHQSNPFRLARFLNEMVRSLLITLKNLMIESIIMVSIVILGFFPIIGFASPLLLILVAAYFYGSAFMDYTLERRGLNLAESNNFCKINMGYTISIGLPFALTLLIPFIGPYLGSFMAIIGSVAATRVSLSLLTKSLNIP